MKISTTCLKKESFFLEIKNSKRDILLLNYRGIMANYMLVFSQNYDQRIQFLRSQGDQLLQSIKLLEIEMNQRRQRYLQPYKGYHLKKLHVYLIINRLNFF